MASDTKHAGRYIAQQVGAFERTDEPTPEETQPEPVTPAATAPLIETAAGHMTSSSLLSFYRWYGDLP